MLESIVIFIGAGLATYALVANSVVMLSVALGNNTTKYSPFAFMLALCFVLVGYDNPAFFYGFGAGMGVLVLTVVYALTNEPTA